MSKNRIGIVGPDAHFDAYAGMMQEMAGTTAVRIIPAHGLDPAASDAVIVTEQTADRFELTCRALSAGCPVLVTNPTGLGVETMIAARKAERMPQAGRLSFGFSLRHLPCVQDALDVAKSRRFGRLLTVRAAIGTPTYTPSRPGAMNQHGLDMLDLLHEFAGPFVEVKGFVDQSAWPKETGEDNVFALLRTHEGVTASLHASSTQWRRTFRLELNYEEGTIWLDRASDTTPACWPDILILSNKGSGGKTDPQETLKQFPAFDPVRAQLNTFLGSLEGAAPVPLANSAEAFDIISTAERILASDESWYPSYGRSL